MKIYVVGTHEKCLTEPLLMSTHNILFHGGIRKNIHHVFGYQWTVNSVHTVFNVSYLRDRSEETV